MRTQRNYRPGLDQALEDRVALTTLSPAFAAAAAFRAGATMSPAARAAAAAATAFRAGPTVAPAFSVVMPHTTGAAARVVNFSVPTIATSTASTLNTLAGRLTALNAGLSTVPTALGTTNLGGLLTSTLGGLNGVGSGLLGNTMLGNSLLGGAGTIGNATFGNTSTSNLFGTNGLGVGTTTPSAFTGFTTSTATPGTLFGLGFGNGGSTGLFGVNSGLTSGMGLTSTGLNTVATTPMGLTGNLGTGFGGTLFAMPGMGTGFVF